MCSKPKPPKIEKADPVAAPPPPVVAPQAPVVNEAKGSAAGSKRKGRSALTIPLNATGVNVPR